MGEGKCSEPSIWASSSASERCFFSSVRPTIVSQMEMISS